MFFTSNKNHHSFSFSFAMAAKNNFHKNNKQAHIFQGGRTTFRPVGTKNPVILDICKNPRSIQARPQKPHPIHHPIRPRPEIFRKSLLRFPKMSFEIDGGCSWFVGVKQKKDASRGMKGTVAKLFE